MEKFKYIEDVTIEDKTKRLECEVAVCTDRGILRRLIKPSSPSKPLSPTPPPENPKLSSKLGVFSSRKSPPSESLPLSAKYPKNQPNFEVFADFHAISSISIKYLTKKEDTFVTICTTLGQQRIFRFKNKDLAHSFISAIDGCYRLFVDSHFYFVDELCPFYIKEFVDAKCFGPITRQFAESLLNSTDDSSACIVRANPETFGEYFITTKLFKGPTHAQISLNRHTPHNHFPPERRFANYRVNRTTKNDFYSPCDEDQREGKEKSSDKLTGSINNIDFPPDYNTSHIGIGFFGRDDAPRFKLVYDFLRYYRDHANFITGLPFDFNNMITPLVKEETSQKIFRFTESVNFPKNKNLLSRRQRQRQRERNASSPNTASLYSASSSLPFSDLFSRDLDTMDAQKRLFLNHFVKFSGHFS